MNKLGTALVVWGVAFGAAGWAAEADLKTVEMNQLTVKNSRCYLGDEIFTGVAVKKNKKGEKVEEFELKQGFQVRQAGYAKNGTKVMEIFVDQHRPTRIMSWDMNGKPLGDLTCKKGAPWEGKRVDYTDRVMKEMDYKEGKLVRSVSYFSNGKKSSEYVLGPDGERGSTDWWDMQGTLVGTLKSKNGRPWDGPLISIMEGVLIGQYDYREGLRTHSMEFHLKGGKAREMIYDAQGRPTKETRWDEAGTVIYDGLPKHQESE